MSRVSATPGLEVDPQQELVISRLFQPTWLETFVVAVFVAGVVTGCEATRLPNPHSGPAKAAAAHGLKTQQPALPFVDLAAPEKLAREADQAIRRSLQKKSA